MGKRLEDLHLDPTVGPAPRDDLAISRRKAEQVEAELTAMIDSGTYSFCWGMLVDMRLTIQQTGRVTSGQETAIHNIKVGAQRHEDQREGWDRHERRTGRRYEGWVDSD